MDKVLLLGENTGIGGINSYLMLLAEGFRSRGVSFSMAAVWPKPDNWLQVQCASHGIQLNVLASRRSIIHLPSAIARLARLISEEKVTIVHSQGHYSNLVARAAYQLSGQRFKLVTTSHGIPPDDAPLGVKLFIQLDWRTYNWSHAVIANSQNTSCRLIEKGVWQEKTRVILHGLVDPKQMESRQVADTTHARSGSAPLVIGCVARLSQEKGCAYLLDAIALLMKKEYVLQLLVVGDGPEGENLKKKVAELGLENTVTFVGWQANTVPYYHQMDIVVVPSLLESLGLTALEGMSYAKPVVATRVFGVPEIVHDGETGLLVAPASPTELALALERLLKDRDLRQRLGRQAQRYVCEYHTLDKMMDDTIAVYKDVQS